MTTFRARTHLTLAKVESTPGTDPTPTVADNAFHTLPYAVEPAFETLRPGEVRRAIDDRVPVLAGGGVRATVPWNLKGSGAGATAPDCDPLLQACGLVATVNSSAVTGTAQAGAAGTITLAASGPSDSNDAYNGMPITITSGTGAGQRRIIADYVGSTHVAHVHGNWSTNPDETSVYSIAACNVYKPASQDLKNITAYRYLFPRASADNVILQKLLGAAGDLTIEAGVRELVQARVALMGVWGGETGVSAPSAETVDATVAPVFMDVDAFLGTAAVTFSRLTVGLGNRVMLPDDPAAAYGVGPAILDGRAVAGTINPYRQLLSVRDALGDFIAGTTRGVSALWGGTAGNVVGLYIPDATYQAPAPRESADGDRVRTEIAFTAGAPDASFYLTFA
ncbi:MAG: hypothetical protein AB7H93_23615 [Vicinamibacterales bacterium]